MLEISNLHVNYGPIEAVRDVSLSVSPGKVTLVLGANGAGKSTTLKAVAGLDKAPVGSGPAGGKDITGQPGAPHRQARHRARAGGAAGVRAAQRGFENLRLGGYTSGKAEFTETLREGLRHVSDPQRPA